MTTTDIIEQDVDWTYNLEFAKIGGNDSDVLYVAGEASNSLKDQDNENMDMDSLKLAFVDYMKNPVIKFMHDKAPQHIGAIGLVVEKYVDSVGKLWETKFGKTPFLVAKFEKNTMPDWMWNAIQKRIYKGFSIGGKAFKKVKGTIYVKSWLETSVVDVPSATGAFFTVLKAACAGPDCPYEKGGPGSGQKGHKTAKDMPEIGERVKISANVGGGYGNVRGFSQDKKYVIVETQKEGKQSYHISDISPVTIGKFVTPSLDKFIHDNGEIHMKVEKFVQAADDFMKGGPGSGQKGHKTVADKKMDSFKDARELLNKGNELKKESEKVQEEANKYFKKYEDVGNSEDRKKGIKLQNKASAMSDKAIEMREKAKKILG